MNVILISPGYPSEMPHFTRGLVEVGARVYGIGDQPTASLAPSVRRCLFDYLQVPSLWDESEVVHRVMAWKRRMSWDRVECLWEPAMLLAARLRVAVGAPGLNVEQTMLFRDKELMKLRLDEAGLRTPRHVLARSVSQCQEAAERIGFPLILKPVDGAGSADTYRVDDAESLRDALPRLHHVPEVSVEEFIEGEEYTFDTITIDGKVAFYNIAWYRPRPLIARSNEWISPQVIALRDLDVPELAAGSRLGFEVISALGFQSGFTHMEWYRKVDGEVVFGEIGARPPGAHQVDQMNFVSDIDVFTEWGRAVCFGRFEASVERRYNVATVYKRAQGQGRIQRILGRRELMRRFGPHLVWDNLLPLGARRRNWLQTLVSDGFVVLRHPDLDAVLEMADAFGEQLVLQAG